MTADRLTISLRCSSTFVMRSSNTKPGERSTKVIRRRLSWKRRRHTSGVWRVSPEMRTDLRAMEDDEVELNLPGLPSVGRCHPGGTRPCNGHGMKCAVRIRPKAVTPKPAPQIRFTIPRLRRCTLVEVMPPAMRRELGGCSWRAPEGEGELIIGPGERRTDEPSYKLA
jgi:hypothetical protein